MTKVFGGLVAVNQVSFSVYPEQIKAIIGPNGAGKTTVFNILSGLLKPSSGRVFFEDIDISGLKPHKIAALGSGRTFQNTMLFDRMSVVENVMVAQETRVDHGFFAYLIGLPSTRKSEREMHAKAIEILKLVGLEKRAGELAGNLPAGERHLLEIARALATEPRVLLLDEPAAGLNQAETQFLIDIIYRIREHGTTVILVEHDMGLVMQISDEIVVLDQGRKIAEGPPLLIQEDERVIEAYLGSWEDA